MSDTTTPNDGTKNPETDAATPESPREPVVIDYDAAATEPEIVTGTGSHAAVPSTFAAADSEQANGAQPTLADDYSAPRRDESVFAPTAAAPGVAPEAVIVPATAVIPAPVEQAAPQPVYPSAPQSPIYVQAPVRPADRSNRGPGILIAVLATVVFAALYAVAVLIIAGLTSATMSVAAQTFIEFAVRPVFYVPVIFFFIAFALLIAIVNRGGWWAYVLFGFLVAVVVYFSYIAGALLTVQAWNLTPAEASRFLSTQWLNPAAIAAGVIAREVPIWTGAWIARRGKQVTVRNSEARSEYERLLAEGPPTTR